MYSDYYKMDDQLHCIHCYGHASVSLYSAYAFALAGQSLVKTAQRCELSAIYCGLCKSTMCIFPNFLVFVG